MSQRPEYPPGPSFAKLLALVLASADPYAHLEQCQATYGDVFTIRVPGVLRIVMVADPATVRTLVTAGYDDLSRKADNLRLLLGDHAVIFQQGEEHKKTRKLMAPPFHGDRMRAYGADMARVSDDVLGRWRDGERRVLRDDFQEITLRVILKCVLGGVDEQRLTDLARYFVDYVDEMLAPLLQGANIFVSSERLRALLRTLGEGVRRGERRASTLPVLRVADRLGAIDRILFEEIARSRRLSDAERAERVDLLSMLIAARFDDGSALSDEALRDHIMAMLLGGYETSATTLAWTIDCALRNPGTLDRLRDEVASVMGESFDPSKIKSLTYLGAVINESMRLRPIAPAMPRELRTETTIGGYSLPAGTLVAPSIYLMQRDPRVWSDPTVFRPERFLEKKPSVYEFFPFGAGVWRCIGAQFAEYEMRVVLARLVAHAGLEAEKGAQAQPAQRGFTIAPSNGVPVRVRLRGPASQPLTARESGAAATADS
jgi:cytochrome P450